MSVHVLTCVCMCVCVCVCVSAYHLLALLEPGLDHLGRVGRHTRNDLRRGTDDEVVGGAELPLQQRLRLALQPLVPEVNINE